MSCALRRHEVALVHAIGHQRQQHDERPERHGSERSSWGRRHRWRARRVRHAGGGGSRLRPLSESLFTKTTSLITPPEERPRRADFDSVRRHPSRSRPRTRFRFSSRRSPPAPGSCGTAPCRAASPPAGSPAPADAQQSSMNEQRQSRIDDPLAEHHVAPADVGPQVMISRTLPLRSVPCPYEATARKSIRHRAGSRGRGRTGTCRRP